MSDHLAVATGGLSLALMLAGAYLYARWGREG